MQTIDIITDNDITQDMTYRDRYRLIYTLLLTALLAGGSITAMAQSSGTSTGVVVRGNVYGGGNLADVKTNTEVNMSSDSVDGNVFGGGKGSDDNYLGHRRVRPLCAISIKS